MVEFDEITKLCSSMSGKSLVHELVDQANQNGGIDNTTDAISRIKDWKELKKFHVSEKLKVTLSHQDFFYTTFLLKKNQWYSIYSFINCDHCNFRNYKI